MSKRTIQIVGSFTKQQTRSDFTERSFHDVRQDNYAPQRVSTASPQPLRIGTSARTRPPQTKSDRVKKHSTRRQTVLVAGWVKRPIRAELEQIAKDEGLSFSKTVATLLEEAVRQRLHVRHAVLLEPLIRQAIAKEHRKDRARFAALLVRIAFDANITRNLVGNVLGRQPGITPDSLNRIRDWSTRKAKESITRRTPQIEELVEVVEKWLAAGEEDDAAT